MLATATVLSACAGVGGGEVAETGVAPTTTTDPYGADPSVDRGTREAVCRGGDAANRPGRARLAAFIATEWPDVVARVEEEVGQGPCRQTGRQTRVTFTGPPPKEAGEQMPAPREGNPLMPQSMAARVLEDGAQAAETEWLEKWTAGPTEPEGRCLPSGAEAPDLVLLDHTGAERALSEFWAHGPALLMFWRHFGCNCGLARAERLNEELARYAEAGLNPVIVGQGEPARSDAYRTARQLSVPVLCDPDHAAYRAYGLGQWQVERILRTAPPEYWAHPNDLGTSFQAGRRADGRPPVDDPWRATGEFVIGPDGVIRLSYAYQYCEDYPPPELLTTAARLI